MSNNIPNLDAMSIDELWIFHGRYSRPTRKDAAELIGDKRPGYTTICGTLAAYAINKAVAMRCRIEGDIQTAEIYEIHCDQAYIRLPQDLRW